MILGVADPDDSIYGKGEPPTEKMLAETTIFELPQSQAAAPWRCATCYRTRFETMCFGMNDPGSTHCQYDPCGKASREDCGWSFEIEFEKLPEGTKGKVTQRYAPKIVSLLRTKWPGAVITFQEGVAPPSV